MKTTKRKREVADGSKPATARSRAVARPARAVAKTAAAPAAPAPVEVEVATPIEAATVPVVALPANCTVKDAAALKQALCGVAGSSETVTIDVAALERIDTATMQLLCAFVRDRAARSQHVAWRGTSQALEEATRLLGVSALLASGGESGKAADNLGAAA
jgi:ABC-type transporter Mla MlaB component